MHRFLAPPTLMLCVLLAGTVGEAWAQQRDQPQPQRSQPRSGEDLSDSVRRIERRTGGQVLSAERLQFDGRDVSRIKVMDERGRVRVYVDDPQQRDERRPPASPRDDD